VKRATQLLQGGGHGAPYPMRAPRLAAFATLAGAPQGSGAVVLLLRRLWSSPLPGKVKETFWRLVYNGLPTAVCMRQNSGCPWRADTPSGGLGWRPDQALRSSGYKAPTFLSFETRNIHPTSSLLQTSGAGQGLAARGRAVLRISGSTLDLMLGCGGGVSPK
jgi:hypothetical protein